MANPKAHSQLLRMVGLKKTRKIRVQKEDQRVYLLIKLILLLCVFTSWFLNLSGIGKIAK